MTNTYDALIQKYAERYLIGVDWRMLKAQLIAESGLNPRAVSPVGAQGIAQFMPATWKEVTTKLGMTQPVNVFVPSFAIKACAFYMASLREEWSDPRPESDRYQLALASYNAGLGNLLKAQKSAGGSRAYQDIIKALSRITGVKNAEETTQYVIRINAIFKKLVVEDVA